MATFAIAAVSDGVDGFVARAYNQKTKLGAALECVPEANALRKRIRDELDAVRTAVEPFARVKVLREVCERLRRALD